MFEVKPIFPEEKSKGPAAQAKRRIAEGSLVDTRHEGGLDGGPLAFELPAHMDRKLGSGSGAEGLDALIEQAHLLTVRELWDVYARRLRLPEAELAEGGSSREASLAALDQRLRAALEALTDADDGPPVPGWALAFDSAAHAQRWRDAAPRQRAYGLFCTEPDVHWGGGDQGSTWKWYPLGYHFQVEPWPSGVPFVAVAKYYMRNGSRGWMTELALRSWRPCPFSEPVPISPAWRAYPFCFLWSRLRVPPAIHCSTP